MVVRCAVVWGCSPRRHRGAQSAGYSIENRPDRCVMDAVLRSCRKSEAETQQRGTRHRRWRVAGECGRSVRPRWHVARSVGSGGSLVDMYTRRQSFLATSVNGVGTRSGGILWLCHPCGSQGPPAERLHFEGVGQFERGRQ